MRPISVHRGAYSNVGSRLISNEEQKKAGSKYLIINNNK